MVAGVAFTANMVQPKPAAQGAFYFQKIFGDGDFLAAGQLIIPPGSTKPTKGTKDNTFVRSPSIHLVRHMSSHSIRSSMSSKARFSSACTRRILCCLLEACSWFLEVRATRRDNCDDITPDWCFLSYPQAIYTTFRTSVSATQNSSSLKRARCPRRRSGRKRARARAKPSPTPSSVLAPSPLLANAANTPPTVPHPTPCKARNRSPNPSAGARLRAIDLNLCYYLVSLTFIVHPALLCPLRPSSDPSSRSPTSPHVLCSYILLCSVRPTKHSLPRTCSVAIVLGHAAACTLNGSSLPIQSMYSMLPAT